MSATLPRPDADRALARVHGYVRRVGRPLAWYELSFRALGEGGVPQEGDWDFTDENGRYEVELPVGRYVVSCDDGVQMTEILVPLGTEETVFDIDLGPARSADRE